MGAQYFTAVSSQRGLRHVGISEADYAMQFIYLKPPIPLQTHATCSGYERRYDVFIVRKDIT